MTLLSICRTGIFFGCNMSEIAASFWVKLSVLLQALSDAEKQHVCKDALAGRLPAQIQKDIMTAGTTCCCTADDGQHAFWLNLST